METQVPVALRESPVPNVRFQETRETTENQAAPEPKGSQENRAPEGQPGLRGNQGSKDLGDRLVSWGFPDLEGPTVVLVRPVDQVQRVILVQRVLKVRKAK